MVLDERRKPEYLAKNLSWQTVENQQTQSTSMVGQGIKTGHIVGKQVLSLHQPCSLFWFLFVNVGPKYECAVTIFINMNQFVK